MKSKMKRQQKTVIALLAAAVVLSISFGVWASGSASAEPVELITKDYIDNYLLNYINNADKSNKDSIIAQDERIKELEALLEASEFDMMALESGIGELEKQIEELEGKLQGVQGPSDNGGTGGTYETVHLTKGQKLMASGDTTESCEVVLRSGEAKAVSSYPDMGLSDLSDGKNLLNGDVLSSNHSVIIPRGSDGRGIKCVSAEVWVLVRGKYTIV